MEHALHLSARHFVREIAPPSVQAIARKVRRVLQKAEKNGDVNLNDLDNELDGLPFNNDDGSEDDEGDDDFDVSDALGKALALVNQVGLLLSCVLAVLKFCNKIRASPQALTFFRDSC